MSIKRRLQTNGIHEIVNILRSDAVRRNDLADYLQKISTESEYEYIVEVHWTWGGSYCFKEVVRFRARDLSEIEDALKRVCVKIARHSSFDCMRLHYPLYPAITAVAITPAVQSKWIYASEIIGLDIYMKNEIARTRRLIESGELFVNGDYDITQAPENNGRVIALPELDND